MGGGQVNKRASRGPVYWHLHPEPLTFLSRLLVPDEWRAFRKPAVVDQRVGFLLEGGSSAWTRASPGPNGPLTVSRAGSLLRRTWRGISEGGRPAARQNHPSELDPRRGITPAELLPNSR